MINELIFVQFNLINLNFCLLKLLSGIVGQSLQPKGVLIVPPRISSSEPPRHLAFTNRDKGKCGLKGTDEFKLKLLVENVACGQ